MIQILSIVDNSQDESNDNGLDDPNFDQQGLLDHGQEVAPGQSFELGSPRGLNYDFKIFLEKKRSGHSAKIQGKDVISPKHLESV